MIKKLIFSILLVCAIRAQQDGPGNLSELEKAIKDGDQKTAALEVAWQFKKLTPEQREHIMQLAQEAAQKKQDEISYKYLYRDWKKIATTAAKLWGAYTAGKYAYDKAQEIQAAAAACIPLDNRIIPLCLAVYSAEAAALLAIQGGTSLYELVTLQSAKAEHTKAKSVIEAINMAKDKTADEEGAE